MLSRVVEVLIQIGGGIGKKAHLIGGSEMVNRQNDHYSCLNRLKWSINHTECFNFQAQWSLVGWEGWLCLKETWAMELWSMDAMVNICISKKSIQAFVEAFYQTCDRHGDSIGMNRMLCIWCMLAL